MARTAFRSVGDAIEATRTFLLPASLRRFGALAVVVLFLGTPGTPIPANPQFADPTFWEVSDPGEVADSGEFTSAGDGSAFGGNGVELLDPGTWPPWLLAGVAVVGVLIALYTFLGVVMRFVLVEALHTDEVEIRRDASAYLGDGLRVFGLRIVLWGPALPVLAGSAVAIAGVGPWTVDGPGAAILGTLATAVFVVAWAIDVCTLQFVVPTMVASDGGVLAGWRRFWATLRADPVEYALYGVVRILLGIGVGIAASIGVLVVLGLAGVVLGTVAAIVVVLAGGFGSLGAVSLTMLGLLLAIFVLVGVAATAAVAVPFQVYLWVYALLVLGDTDPALDLIPERREAVRGGPAVG